MDEKLEKIDEIVKRTKVTYEEAKRAYEEANGDLLDALIIAESFKKSNRENEDDLKKKGEEIINEIKKILKKGNTTKITIKKQGETILNIPVTAGAVGIVLAQLLSVAGLTAAMLTRCTIEILQTSGEVINLNSEVEKGFNKVKQDIENISKN